MSRSRLSLRIAALFSVLAAGGCRATPPPADPPHAATTSTVAQGFPREDAKTALAAASRGLRSCAAPGRSEEVVADLRFDPNGSVGDVDVDASDATTSACVRGKLAEVAVTPFEGDPVTMRVRVRL